MRILILRALGLGDFLTAIPAYRAIRRRYRRAEITLAAPAALGPLVDVVGIFDRHIAVGPLEPLPSQIGPIDVSVNLHGRGPQSHRLLLAASARTLIAFAHPDVPGTAAMPKFIPCEHEVARWCRLVAAFDCDANADDLDLPAPRAQISASARGAILIHPGAASASRRWPYDRYVALIRRQRRRGYRVILTGGPDERAYVESIAHATALDPDAVFAGRTTLDDLASLVRSSALVVCGDTGVAHLATAFRRPSVLLFGPTSPAVWGPPIERVEHRVIWKKTVGDPFARSTDPGLLQISVDDVDREIAWLVATKRATLFHDENIGYKVRIPAFLEGDLYANRYDVHDITQ